MLKRFYNIKEKVNVGKFTEIITKTILFMNFHF